MDGQAPLGDISTNIIMVHVQVIASWKPAISLDHLHPFAPIWAEEEGILTFYIQRLRRRQETDAPPVSLLH